MQATFLIIGGGISGLSAAWQAQLHGIPYTVLEADNRWGGKLQTVTHELEGGARFRLEAAAESFITRKMDAYELAQELGLDDAILAQEAEAHGVGVLYRGEVHPMPTSAMALARSRLLTWRGKLRLLAEPFIKTRKDDDDETLAAFLARRLGQEASQRLFAPILGGIYHTDPHRQSVIVSAAHMRNLEYSYGSLFVGMLRSMWQTRKTSALGIPRFIRFDGGTQTFVNALVAQLTGDLRLNAPASSLSKHEEGYRVTLADGETLFASHILLTTPAHVSAHLLASVAPASAEALKGLPVSSIGTLFLGYRQQDLPAQPPLVRELMIPRTEGRTIDAVLWSSLRQPDSAPEGYALLKVFFGSARPDLIDASDETLGVVAHEELRSLFGLSAPPVFARAFRWKNSHPQADVEHIGRVIAINDNLPKSIALAGSPYYGAGVPNCVEHGRVAVDGLVYSIMDASS